LLIIILDKFYFNQILLSIGIYWTTRIPWSCWRAWICRRRGIHRTKRQTGRTRTNGIYMINII